MRRSWRTAARGSISMAAGSAEYLQIWSEERRNEVVLCKEEPKLGSNAHAKIARERMDWKQLLAIIVIISLNDCSGMRKRRARDIIKSHTTTVYHSHRGRNRFGRRNFLLLIARFGLLSHSTGVDKTKKNLFRFAFYVSSREKARFFSVSTHARFINTEILFTIVGPTNGVLRPKKFTILLERENRLRSFLLLVMMIKMENQKQRTGSRGIN